MSTERPRRKPGRKPRPMTVIETFEPTPDWEQRRDTFIEVMGRLIARRVLAMRRAAEQGQERAS